MAFTYLDVSAMPLSCFERKIFQFAPYIAPAPQPTSAGIVLSKCNELCSKLDKLSNAYKDLPEHRTRAIPQDLSITIRNVRSMLEKWKQEVHTGYITTGKTNGKEVSESPLDHAEPENLDACKDVFTLAIQDVATIEKTWNSSSFSGVATELEAAIRNLKDLQTNMSMMTRLILPSVRYGLHDGVAKKARYYQNAHLTPIK